MTTQLAQVDQLERSGALDAAAAGKARARLRATRPGGAADGARAGAALQAGPSRRLLIGLCSFVLLFGLAGYAWRGNFEALRVAPGEPGTAAAEAGGPVHSASPGQVEAMAERLALRLKEQPDDAEGWAMLARSYSALGRPADALPAYRRVAELRPDDAQSWADLADGLASAQGNRLDGEPARLILKALKLDPNHTKALALAGTLAFNQGDAATAALYWERALRGVEPGSDIARQLQGALDEARSRAGQPPAAAASAPVPELAPSPADTGKAAARPAPAVAAAVPAANGGAVQGRVTLAPALQTQVKPDDTVFIFARPAQGARAPLAILRKQVRDLPADFTLDDSLAMSPQARLSTAAQVIIGARISKSGNAMPQAGDLQALSAPVAPGTRGVQLQIAEVLR